MQIKLNGKGILIGHCKFNNVYLIDIDEHRIEINDINNMVIGVTDIKDFAIVDTNSAPIEYIEEEFKFKNGATVICNTGSFNDIYKINKNALVYELIGANGVIDGRINHFGNIKVDIAEYDEDGHLTGEVYSLK